MVVTLGSGTFFKPPLSAGVVKYTNCTSVKLLRIPPLFDGEALVLELWGMWSTPSLPLLLGPL